MGGRRRRRIRELQRRWRHRVGRDVESRVPRARDPVTAVEELGRQIGEKRAIEAVSAKALSLSVAGLSRSDGEKIDLVPTIGLEVKGCHHGHQVLMADLNSDTPVVRQPRLYRPALTGTVTHRSRWNLAIVERAHADCRTRDRPTD